MTAPVGSRHYCPCAGTPGSGHPHTSGDGRARRKRCAGCGAELVTVAVTYGVFVWTGTNRYPLASAVATFAREAAAQRYADANPGREYVVRPVSV